MVEHLITALLSKSGLLTGLVLALFASGALGYNVYRVELALGQIDTNNENIMENTGRLAEQSDRINNLDVKLDEMTNEQQELNRTVRIWLCTSEQAKGRRIAKRLLGCEEILNEE